MVKRKAIIKPLTSDYAIVRVLTSFLQMVFYHNCTYHKHIAYASRDGERSQKEQSPDSAPVGTEGHRTNRFRRGR